VEAPYQGSDMDDVDGLQLRAAGLHKELSKLEARATGRVIPARG